MRFKGTLQYNPEDCGAACLVSILKYYEVNIPISQIRNELSYGKEGASLLGIVNVAEKYGLQATSYYANYDELVTGVMNSEVIYPFIAHFELSNGDGHYVVVLKMDKLKVKIFDPAEGFKKISINQFHQLWTGYIVNFESMEGLSRINFSESDYKLLKFFLKNNRVYFLKIFLLSILATIISYAGAIFTRYVIDSYILNSGYSSSNFNIIFLRLGFLVSLFIFLYFLQVIFNFEKGKTVALLAKKFNIELSKKFYKKILTVPDSILNRIERGEILSRFQSILELQQVFLGSVFIIMINSFISIIGGIVLFSISKELFALVIVMLILYGGVITYFLPKIRVLNKKFYTEYSKELTDFSQSLNGVSTIKSTNSESWFKQKFEFSVRGTADSQYKLGKMGYFIDSITTFIELVGMLLILVTGAVLVKNNHFTMGTLIEFQTMMTFFIEPFRELVLLQDDIQNFKITFSRLNDIVLEIQESTLYRNRSSIKIKKYDIELLDISYSTGFTKPIIENINLKIKQGEHVGIVGKSGSGKSTLLKLIATINTPTSGEILIGGYNYSYLSLEDIRSNISYVEQEPHLFSGSVMDNLTLGRDYLIDNEFLFEVCEACGIFNINGLGHSVFQLILMESAKNLSGGQKQQIALARAILQRPKILILDEATGNIDSYTEHKIHDYFNEHCQEMTIISVSHSDTLKDYSQKIFQIHDRKLKKL